MSHPVLTLNTGSSSLKFALYGDDHHDLRLIGEIENIGHLARGEQHTLFHARDAAGQVLADAEVAGHDHAAALGYLLDWLHSKGEIGNLAAVSHRIVHGGADFTAPVLLNEAILAQLDALIPLAPLHQPHGLLGVRTMQALLPDTPQIACFDTAFHRSNPEVLQRFALPEWLWESGVRRYGFHGLSYEYINRVLPEHVAASARKRVIVAHLGNGASVCAIKEGRSIASSMGFTALDGLMMGTRCGRLDAGVVLYLQQQGRSSAEISDLLYRQSGLLGVSGHSADMRTLLARDDAESKRAVEMFCMSAAREIASLLVPLGGLDALVFTGGIGSHAAPVRQRICEMLAWLDLRLDITRNQSNHPGLLNQRASRIQILSLNTNEESILAEAGFALSSR